MLRELHVRNLAVLAAASVEFQPGLNVLSGETGAGKSIVVDSLALLAGARASNDLIRSGADALSVSGVFEPVGEGWRAILAEAGLEPSDSDGSPEQADPQADSQSSEILVRREINHSGRNRVFVNDVPTTLRTLTRLAPFLLRIHGQHEELGLVIPDLQRQWLDTSAGSQAEPLVTAVTETYRNWSDLAERLDRLTGDRRERTERIDLLRFQAGEIDAVELVAGEDVELRTERDQLRNGEAIRLALGGTHELLWGDEGSVADRLAQATALLADIEEWVPDTSSWRTELEQARIAVDEVARSAGRRLDAVDADPARLDAIETRLAAIERLCHKFGADAAAVLERRQSIADELAALEVDEEGRTALETELAEALGEYRQAAMTLSEARRGWGRTLAKRIEKEIGELGLAKARLMVELERRPSESSPLTVDGRQIDFGPRGFDRVVFLFAPNPGETPQPLAKIASGGELSRLYLGLQLAALGNRRSNSPTLVFDEVDSGVGGAEAAALGRKLRRLAEASDVGQILAVTHLPQVASFGHHHLQVSKSIDAGRTRTSVVALDDPGRVEEIARMLAGEEVTELSRSHAVELLAVAEQSSTEGNGAHAAHSDDTAPVRRSAGQ